MVLQATGDPPRFRYGLATRTSKRLSLLAGGPDRNTECNERRCAVLPQERERAVRCPGKTDCLTARDLNTRSDGSRHASVHKAPMLATPHIPELRISQNMLCPAYSQVLAAARRSRPRFKYDNIQYFPLGNVQRIRRKTAGSRLEIGRRAQRTVSVCYNGSYIKILRLFTY